MCGGGCGARAAAALLHVNLLLVVFAGAALATGARLRWDPSLYVAVRELLPREYRVLAGALPAAGATLLALAHLALAAAAPRRRPRLLYTYAAVMFLAVILEAALLGWVAARVREFLHSAQAEQMQQLLATREHLQPLLQHLAQWHPLPDHLASLIQEAEDDMPWNGYVAAAALTALLALQLLGAALALAASCARPHDSLVKGRPRSRTPLSASRLSLVDSFRSGASSRAGSARPSAPGSPASERGEWAPLRTKYKNGRIVPL